MRVWFGLLFAASGAAALVYEVTWTRLLTLQMGHGVAAASTVLAAFMGGLAVGSALGGRRGARLDGSSALRTYAALELIIAVLALLLPYELAALNPVLAAAYANGDGGAVFGILRLGIGLVLLALPAAAMGATFPIASRWFVQRAADSARDAGTMYAANTVGAALGALAAGFVLLPRLGLSGSTWVGVGLNVVAAVGAWAISRVPQASEPEASAPRDPVPSRGGEASKRSRSGRTDETPGRRRRSESSESERTFSGTAIAAAALGVSGFASLSMQVVWTRVLALIFGPTTYAFSVIVAVFIAGLAAGAALAARVATRSRQPSAGLALCLALSVGAASGAATFVERALVDVASVMASPGSSFGDILVRQALVALALLAPMAVAFGAAFPFAIATGARREGRVTADLGFIYAVNTGGAIAGALITGFALIPLLGLRGSIQVTTVVGAVGAALVLLLGGSRGRARLGGLALAGLMLALGVLLPEWDRLLLSSGGYKYASAIQGLDLRVALSSGELLYYGEGASSTVAVRRVGGTTSLAIDGKVDASDSGDMLTQRLLAHVPLLLHPDPKRVAILGLGSGVTLGSALTHPVTRADVLEISPEVVQASRFFDDENHRAAVDPRTRIVVGDGRTHLQLTRDSYDVIVSEPSNPWMAGIASLFTREFFEAARARLAPGGILCQWAHTYDISAGDLQSIVATFSAVFPEGTLWLVGDGDVLLVGANGPLEPRFAEVGRAFGRPGVGQDLASVGVLEPFHVLSMFVAGGHDLADWAGNAALQSDDRSGLEFSGPQTVFGRITTDNATNLRALAAARQAPPAIASVIAAASPAAYRDRGAMLLRADAARPAYEDFARAAAADPTDAAALDGLIRAAAPIRRTADARALLTKLAGDPTHVAAKLALSRLLASEGAYDQAVQIPFAVLQSDPGNVAALEQMASILSDAGDVERMRPVVARLRAEAPASEAAHYYSASLLFMEERVDLALVEARRVLAVNPSHAKAHNLVGACLATMNQRDEARRAFLASIEANPRDPATYTNLATLELQAGDRARAARHFAEALTIDPTSETARRGLAGLQRP
jgi:spermidine synthase